MSPSIPEPRDIVAMRVSPRYFTQHFGCEQLAFHGERAGILKATNLVPYLYGFIGRLADAADAANLIGPPRYKAHVTHHGDVLLCEATYSLRSPGRVHGVGAVLHRGDSGSQDLVLGGGRRGNEIDRRRDKYAFRSFSNCHQAVRIGDDHLDPGSLGRGRILGARRRNLNHLFPRSLKREYRGDRCKTVVGLKIKVEYPWHTGFV